MTELANYGLLLFYLAFVTRLWKVRHAAGIDPPVTKGLPSLILACLTVLVCCTYRVTYAVLWIPLIFAACDAEFSGKMALAFLAALLGTLFVYYITALLACPFTSGFLYNFLRAGSAEMALRMLDVLGQDYIRTARAKGVQERKVIFKHALKNALIPVITYVGPLTAYILTGSMVVETVFTVGGLGTEFVKSISNRDYPMIMGTTIFLATLMVTMTLISDLIYKVVDPKITFD